MARAACQSVAATPAAARAATRRATLPISTNRSVQSSISCSRVTRRRPSSQARRISAKPPTSISAVVSISGSARRRSRRTRAPCWATSAANIRTRLKAPRVRAPSPGLHEQHPRLARVIGHELDERPDRRPRLGPRVILGLTNGLEHLRRPPPRPLVEQRQQQLVPVGEALVEVARRQPGSAQIARTVVACQPSVPSSSSAASSSRARPLGDRRCRRRLRRRGR